MMRRLIVVVAIVGAVVVSGVHVSWSAAGRVDGVTPAEAREGSVPGFGRYTRAHCRTGQHFDASVCNLADYRGDFTVGEIDLLLARAFPAEVVRARRVAQCESTYRAPSPRTGRWAHNTVSGDYGLMQINRRTWEAWVTGTLGDWSLMWDVGPNLVAAQHVVETQGWTAWVCR